MITTETFTFDTARLRVLPWRQFIESISELAQAIAPVTTPKVMATLPPSWSSLDTNQERIHWIMEREQEGLCLCFCDAKNGEVVGILLLSPQMMQGNCVDVRVGYFIAEEFWGRGFASEVVKGLVQIARSHELIDSVTGGVDPSNIGSVKVLTNNGFVHISDESNQHTHIYRFQSH